MYLHHLKAVIARLHPAIRDVTVHLPGQDRDVMPVTITADPAAVPAIKARLEQAAASITPRHMTLRYDFVAAPSESG